MANFFFSVSPVFSWQIGQRTLAFKPAFDTATNQLQQLPNARLVFGQQRGYSARPMKRRIKLRLAKQ